MKLKSSSKSGHASHVLKPKPWGAVVWMSSGHRMLVGSLPATKRRQPPGNCATLPLSHCCRALERPEE